MTRDQQTASKKLEAAQAEYLSAYGWVQEGRLWKHPKLNALGVSCAYTTLDAMAQTRAEPTLGWPNREGSVYTARTTRT